MKILKELFETINKEAFKLKSVKEIYTRTLSAEELDDNDTDYISGFQVIDHNLRITILEGISGKAMSLVKERLPKLELNSDKKKIFSNSKILFNKRIYSNFNLCLKFIKLRNPLTHILNTADIYLKANKYREIFNAFMQIGFILQSPTFESITNANLFPSFESLTQLERKYADIINDEDLSGVPSEKKKKKKAYNNSEKVHTTNSALTTENNVLNHLNNMNKNNNNNNISNNGSVGNSINNSIAINNINNSSNHIGGQQHRQSSPLGRGSGIRHNSKSEQNKTRSPKIKEGRVPKLDSYNVDFIKKKKEEIGKSMSFNRKENFMKTHKMNSDYIHRLNARNSASPHFWTYEKMTPLENIIASDTKSEEGSNFDNNSSNNNNNNNLLHYNMDNYNSNQNFNGQGGDLNSKLNVLGEADDHKKQELYMYSQQRNNMFNNHLNELRDKCLKDKDHYYTYSKDYLTLSFPLYEQKNEEYVKFVENKKVFAIFKAFLFAYIYLCY